MTCRGSTRLRWWLLGLAALGLLAAGCIPAGTHTVSSFGAGGVSPGLWRSLGGDGCYWARLANFSGGVDSIIANHLGKGPTYVQIEASDAGFEQSRCVPFWQEPGPFAKPLATPGQPFGEGEFKIGYEVAPGRYQANPAPGESCYWERLSGFHGTGEIIANDLGEGPQVVEIEASDVGFSSTRCGTWNPAG